MKISKTTILLLIVSITMFLCGCRSRKMVAKYGAPATKYGIRTTEFIQTFPQNPSKKV